ncbi:DNA methylase [Mycoplasmopsis californica]|uniref:16S rRNA (Guanine(966)-N(2))-methyltransferase RsmD n=1 Tax=Mycoplasmopsis equigenitalium TaxID=114883 RepID=A0ABY5J4Q8_9BACT|nr:16S rRNA (guanine(966)-N(2))-methyltransferase RsmD [Mycoplasmopsis equigenitalium]UUD37117.1 16S rRNA (guanine(966)-N(2))-methyltransferase RsmD [Mycoplasmopsis equigenitalium]VEU69577.1 DNA methylase [Mycoplasmopsis californica]
MIRIISGKYRHRLIKQPKLDSARPTQDRVKEVVFNSLRFKENKKLFLDLFAGCGSIGIEAISNGFEKTHFIEIDKNNATIIKQNLTNLQIQNYELFQENATFFLEKCKFKYDVIYLDPPYLETKLLNDVIHQIYTKKLLKNDGILIVETRFEEQINTDGFNKLKTKKFGQNKVLFLAYLN